MEKNIRSFNNSISFRFILILLITIFSVANSDAYTVASIKAAFSNGQVFITWSNPSATNLQYNVYRSSSKFTAASQLTAEKFMGFVRDSSSKNIRMSYLSFEPIYFRITDGGAPLTPMQGLYVVTCTNNQPYYYAVTVTTLSNNSEDKSIVVGQNSLSNAVNEICTKPLPVYQYSEAWSNGESVDRYVEFGNNQTTPLYPPMNSTGSYGFNFYVLKRGTAQNYPLLLMEEGELQTSIKGNGLGEIENKTITNCYIISVDDWLPIPKPNGDIGDNTYFCCYHEGFNIYSGSNPIPTDGIVKVFSQHRYIEALEWAKKHLPVDAARVYTVGNSAGGFGAELTAAIIPEEIAAVYSIVDPTSIGTNGSDLYKSMWGTSKKDLATDVPDWRTGDALHFNELTDMKLMLNVNEQRNIPMIFDVHGKHDHTVGWNEKKIAWLDSLQSNHAGGVFYWDGRDHNAAGQDFLDAETTPDFFRYATNKSFPAFSNCSINQDPGNGNQNNGDPVGAINGYLDFDDDITDETCNYSVNVFINDFYEGGVLFPNQYSTCTTDLSFRRLQAFEPSAGAIIKWKNIDANGIKVQSGSLTYIGGVITLKGIIINKSINTIKLKIKGCAQRTAEDNDDALLNDDLSFSKSPDGYTVQIHSEQKQIAHISLYDLLGQTILTEEVSLNPGGNTFNISSQHSGLFIVQVKTESFNASEKLFF